MTRDQVVPALREFVLAAVAGRPDPTGLEQVIRSLGRGDRELVFGLAMNMTVSAMARRRGCTPSAVVRKTERLVGRIVDGVAAIRSETGSP